ncbi:MAG TPA: dockerin type I domain-containing protein [Candidatus Paceibacterota bacterium]|jgi:hypothetical protein|nr:dockerin type I domain-containing protein [Candidatus Paceibacterota bacterium]
MSKSKLAIIIFILGLPLSYISAGTILSPHKYAWSNNVGYINFENVIVNGSALSGYAWSANKGFINFNPAQGGVFNDGAGNLSGSAWGEQLGWINFSNVKIDGSGKFSGTANGTLAGTITFDCPNYCDVETDWRPVTPPVVPPVSGGSSASQVINLVSMPDFKVLDILKDGIINILDLNIMMVNWGLTQNLASAGSIFNPADMNKDGVVDIFDFNMLMVYWGSAYQL